MESKGIDWAGMAKNVIRETTKMSEEEYKKFASFRPDFKVETRQKDQWYLTINGSVYRVGYIFLRNLFLVYDTSGKMVLEMRPKKENKS